MLGGHSDDDVDESFSESERRDEEQEDLGAGVEANRISFYREGVKQLLSTDTLDNVDPEQAQGFLMEITDRADLSMASGSLEDYASLLGTDVKVLESADSHFYRGKDSFFSSFVHCLSALYSIFQKHRMIGDDTEESHFKNRFRFTKIYTACDIGKEIQLQMIRTKEVARQTTMNTDSWVWSHLGDSMLSDKDDELSSYQRLLIFLSNCLREQRLRRSGDSVMEQVSVALVEETATHFPFFIHSTDPSYTETVHNPENKVIRVTELHYWTRYGSIKDVISSFIQRSQNWKTWIDFTANPHSLTNTVNYFKDYQDPNFPNICTDRFTRCVLNGIYTLCQDRTTRNFSPTFVSFGEDSVPASTPVANNFYPVQVEPSIMYRRWYDIPTPTLDRILSHQGFFGDSLMVFYALLGRLMFPLNLLDQWQVVPFITGKAGTGKSTIGTMVSTFFRPEDVATLSSSMEATFGLGPLSKAFLFVCWEVSDGFQMTSADLLSIISGEPVLVRQKYKDAYSKKWDTPGIFMGNGAWGSLVDEKGNLQRRSAVFLFNKAVVTEDHSMLARLTQSEEAIAIQIKSAGAYHALVRHTGDKGFWNMRCLPPLLKKTQGDFLSMINPVKQYLQDHYKNEEGASVGLSALFDDFRTWKRNVPSIKSRGGGGAGGVANKRQLQERIEVLGYTCEMREVQLEDEGIGMAGHRQMFVNGISKDQESGYDDMNGVNDMSRLLIDMSSRSAYMYHSPFGPTFEQHLPPITRDCIEFYTELSQNFTLCQAGSGLPSLAEEEMPHLASINAHASKRRGDVWVDVSNIPSGFQCKILVV